MNMNKLKFFVLTSSIVLTMSGCSSDDSDLNHNGLNLTDNIELTRGEKQAVEGFSEFSYKLMTEATALSDNGEFCISPVSLSITLSMLANASSGECRNQILNALGSENIDELNSLCRKLMQYLPCDTKGSSLAIGNRFWVDKRYKVPSDFKKTISNYFNAGVESVDFNKSSTVSKINKWVYDSTHGKITGILDGDWESYRDLGVITANTVYFKGDWAEEFNRSRTNSAIFHGSFGDVEVSMMHQTLNAAYLDNENIEGIRLYFEGDTNYMDLFILKEGTEIRDLIDYVKPFINRDLESSYEYCTVTLSMPSFKKTFEENEINKILDRIGISELDNADLSPMGLSTTHLSIRHKTSLKIDEEGAELAAVTAVEGDMANSPDEYKKVTLDFDRPFVYIIRNRKTDAILLTGAVTDPR